MLIYIYPGGLCFRQISSVGDRDSLIVIGDRDSLIWIKTSLKLDKLHWVSHRKVLLFDNSCDNDLLSVIIFFRHRVVFQSINFGESAFIKEPPRNRRGYGIMATFENNYM